MTTGDKRVGRAGHHGRHALPGERRVARAAPTAAAAGRTNSSTFCSSSVLPSAATLPRPSSPSAGLAAWVPPRPVVRTPETSSPKKPVAEEGNAAIAPPDERVDADQVAIGDRGQQRGQPPRPPAAGGRPRTVPIKRQPDTARASSSATSPSPGAGPLGDRDRPAAGPARRRAP